MQTAAIAKPAIEVNANRRDGVFIWLPYRPNPVFCGFVVGADGKTEEPSDEMF
jgi:hypothetical protein